MWVILKNKNYRTFLCIDFFSIVGDGLYYLALMTFAASFKDSGTAITMVSVSENLPLALTFFTGMRADSSKDRTRDIRHILFFKASLYLIISIFMGMNQSFWLFSLVCLFNFISDVLGRLYVGISSVVPQLIFKEAQLENSSAVYATNQQIAQVLSQSLGALMITLLSFQKIALLNFILFLMIAIFFLINQSQTLDLFSRMPVKKDPHKTSIIKEFRNFFELRNDTAYQNIFQIVISLMILNSFLATNASILSIAYLSIEKTRILPFTPFLATLTFGNTVSMILGSTLGIKLAVKKQIKTVILWGYLSAILLFIWIQLGQLELAVIASWALYFTLGIINPKLSALLRKSIPVKDYGKITGGLASVLSLGSIFGAFFYNAFASISLSYFSITMIIFIILYLTMVYTRSRKRE